MGSVARGTLALALEPTTAQGRQVLLPATTVAASMSIITQPSSIVPSGHMHLMIVVAGATASGTITIAGKKADGVTAVSETTPTINAATANVAQTVYCTAASYNTVNANGITTTGLTNATITIYGVVQGTKLVPVTFEVNEKFDYHDPADHRGIAYGHFRYNQLNKHVTLSKLDSAFYPDTDVWLAFMAMNSNPQVSTIPAVPTSLLSATPVASFPASLTTQPTSPGMLLVFTVTGTSSYGTITISGTTASGAVTETVVCPGGAGTFYSSNVYTSIASSGLTVTGLTGGSIAVGGIFGTDWVFTLPSANLYTAAFGIFTGTDSSVYPFGYLESVEIDHDATKEMSLSMKATTQDQVILGNRSISPLISSQLPALGQPYDMSYASWPATFYLDPLGSTPFTTQYGDVMSMKLSISTGLMPTFVAKAQQVYDRVYVDGAKVDVKFDGQIDFRDVIQYEQFRQNQKQLLGIKFANQQYGYIGNVGGTLYYKSWSFTLPAKYSTFDEDRSKEMVQAKISGIAEYEPTLGYAARLEIVNQSAPNFATT
jgi:hypothetical protein